MLVQEQVNGQAGRRMAFTVVVLHFTLNLIRLITDVG